MNKKKRLNEGEENALIQKSIFSRMYLHIIPRQPVSRGEYFLIQKFIT